MATRLPNEAWNCAVCTTDYRSKHDRSTNLQDSLVCSKCIQELFDHSLRSETNFPPRWGGVILDPWDFRHVLNTFFLRDFKAKEREWGLAPHLRVYCRHRNIKKPDEECGNFLGRVSDAKTLRKCEKCKWSTCLRCSESLRFNELMATEFEHLHRCNSRADERERREKAFNGLIRGEHYQDCPKCSRRLELKEGCNHLTCLCGMQFCFVCGKPATIESRHWHLGGCPRFGQPGDEHAIHTDHLADDEDAVAGAADDDAFRWRAHLATAREARNRDDRPLLPRDSIEEPRRRYRMPVEHARRERSPRRHYFHPFPPWDAQDGSPERARSREIRHAGGRELRSDDLPYLEDDHWHYPPEGDNLTVRRHRDIAPGQEMRDPGRNRRRRRSRSGDPRCLVQ